MLIVPCWEKREMLHNRQASSIRRFIGIKIIIVFKSIAHKGTAFFWIIQIFCIKKHRTDLFDAFYRIRNRYFLLETCAVINNISFLFDQTNYLIWDSIRCAHVQVANLLCSIELSLSYCLFSNGNHIYTIVTCDRS